MTRFRHHRPAVSDPGIKLGTRNQRTVEFRRHTLLGIVSVGGIGFYLLNASRVMAFDTVTYMLIMIIAVTLVLGGLSMWARRVVR